MKHDIYGEPKDWNDALDRQAQTETLTITVQVRGAAGTGKTELCARATRAMVDLFGAASVQFVGSSNEILARSRETDNREISRGLTKATVEVVHRGR